MAGRNFWLFFIICWSLAQPVWAQLPSLEQKPEVLATGLTLSEKAERESLYFFGLGLICEHEDRLLEALTAYEKAGQLHPQSVAVYRALVPLYLALDRHADALAASRKVVDLNPQDYAVWYLYGRQLREAGKTAEASAAMHRALEVPASKERPDLIQQIYYDLGQIHEGAEEYLAAADSFARAAKFLEHPEAFLDRGNLTRDMLVQRAAEVHERAGRLFARAGKFDQALAAYRQAQNIYPAGAGRLHWNLAQLNLEQNQLPQALANVDTYLRLQPQGMEAYEMKIALLHKLHRDGEVLPWLERATQADPFNNSLKVLLARQLGRSGQTAAAEKRLLELAGELASPELYQGLLSLYQDSGQAAKSLALLDQAIKGAKLRPPLLGKAGQAKAMIAVLRQDAALTRGLVQSAGSIDQLQDDTLVLLAGLADHHHLTDAAERFYRQCLVKLSPDNEPLVFSGLLRLLWKTGKTDAVIELCQVGLRQAKITNHVLFYNDLAKALAYQGKFEEALREVDRALALAADHDRLTVRSLRVRLLTMAKHLDRAEAECLAMLKESSRPGEVMEIRYLLSGIYTQGKQLARAEEQLGLILKVDPNNAVACNDLGYLWADQNKNLAQAEELIRKAIALDRQQSKGPGTQAKTSPDHAAYVDSLGWVLFRRGQIHEARKELERAASLPDGEDPVIWDHLGDVYDHLRLPDQAREAWRKALHFYERDRRRTMDHRYQEIQRKLKIGQ